MYKRTDTDDMSTSETEMGDLKFGLRHRLALGKFDWGDWYIIIFLYVQFWIQLALVSKRGKNVRTMAFPVVR